MTTTKNKQISFKGQDFYIRLDVHKKWYPFWGQATIVLESSANCRSWIDT